MDDLKAYINKIQKISEKHRVKKLFAFGSILTNHFTKKSDIDFLVQFSKIPLEDYFDNYMGLKDNLEKLLSRKIDLVEEQTLENPVLKHSINRTKKLLYDRGENIKVAV